jgi:GT2 family glycosyltransferase
MRMQLSVVILTRKRPQYLKPCLDTLLEQGAERLEVFVVFNPDDQETAELLKHYHCVHAVTVPHSASILAARNVGAQRASCDIIAFTDDDVTFYPGWLDACVGAFDNPQVGGVGGRILDKHTEHSDFTRDEPICKILPDGRYTGNQELDPKRVVEADHLQGCNWAVRREAFEKVGGFDETWGYNLYEELDFALRLRKAGYKLHFIPPMAVYHHLAPSKNRLPKNFRIRFRNVKSLTRAYSRSLGVLPGSITFNYLLRGDTGWKALARNPSLKMISYVASGYCGKLAGLAHGALDKLRGIPRSRPRADETETPIAAQSTKSTETKRVRSIHETT